MFSEDGEDKRTFWQKHKGKILAGAALAAAGGAGYYYRDPIKKKPVNCTTRQGTWRRRLTTSTG